MNTVATVDKCFRQGYGLWTDKRIIRETDQPKTMSFDLEAMSSDCIPFFCESCVVILTTFMMQQCHKGTKINRKKETFNCLCSDFHVYSWNKSEIKYITCRYINIDIKSKK